MTDLDELRARIRDRTRPHGRATPRPWYEIRNAADDDDDAAVVRIYGEIGWSWFGGLTAEDFVRDLDEVSASKIRVEINSPGGDVFDGIAIYNALRAHPAHVTTRVDGLAASAASLIVQAGDHRVMLSSAQMMIHEAWGIVIGPASDMRAMADMLEQQNGVIAGVYASRSDAGDREHFLGLMAAETWLTDSEAVEEGLADEVVDPPRQTQDRGPTLHDEISEAAGAVSGAVQSAERVAALRAERGKGLSQRNRDSLVELRAAADRLDALLTAETTATKPDGTAALQREYARYVATTQGV